MSDQFAPTGSAVHPRSRNRRIEPTSALIVVLAVPESTLLNARQFDLFTIIVMVPSTVAKIITLNDQLRTTFTGGRVLMTPAVYELNAQLRGRALYVMSRYNKFDDDSEHDCGVFIFAGYSFEWRIEYRNRDGTGTSSDPADPEKTFRVLTLYALHDALP